MGRGRQDYRQEEDVGPTGVLLGQYAEVETQGRRRGAPDGTSWCT
ncbi:hypothetical protein SGL43_04162 [Streptomyces globisporus]|uniref:Uncharacterized protein n=1 Tax=Streptomyces globisporus TaxID=1908 RepID=A0ABM9H0L6_STRGL|nr:hypothetical protein SGL43_04162 [Streptomyces globisporus]